MEKSQVSRLHIQLNDGTIHLHRKDRYKRAEGGGSGNMTRDNLAIHTSLWVHKKGVGAKNTNSGIIKKQMGSGQMAQE